MKIVSLTAENIKKLVAVEIVPNGNVVEITGRNAQGKTSVLDCIWWALAGASHIQAQPIRSGETKARIKLDLGEITVERRFTPNGSSLIVENADGARFPGPQKMLDSLIGALSFDPLAFTRMTPREQFDKLRLVAQLDTDIEKLDGLNRGDFDRRTEINRDAKARRARAEGVVVPADAPEAPIDTKALMDAMTNAAQTNGEIEGRRARRTAAVADIAKLRGDAEVKRQEAARLTAEAVGLDTQAKALQDRLDAAGPLPEPVDVTAIRAQLDNAAARNAGYEARRQREALMQEAMDLEHRAAELTEAIAAREKVKADAIARATLPVPDLGFGDGVVTYKGVPFEQASGAEQLRVSMAIAMAANPKLRVLRIADGSLLDEDSMAQISAMAEARDYQVWIERVDSSGKIGFVIEDGHAHAAQRGGLGLAPSADGEVA